MNKEQLKNVISRFYNVDATKTGTEIGLNFTKELVELHSGEIYVESQLFKGSKFIVKLHLDIKLESDIVKNIKNEYS